MRIGSLIGQQYDGWIGMVKEVRQKNKLGSLSR